MLVLCSTRPALFERRPGWAAAAGPDGQPGLHRRLPLAPLDRSASRGLADELLSPLATVQPALRELVAGGAEGNPFQMEQLVGLLIDTGALRLIDGAWAVDGEWLLATPWPTTLTGVLQARLAALPVAQRRALTAEHHAQAADHATDRFAHDAALARVQRALALLASLPAGPGPSAPRWQLLERREYTFKLLARRADQRAAIVVMAEAVDAVADDRRRAEAINRLSRLCSHLGDCAGLQATSRKALILSEQAGDASLYLRALRELGDSHCKRGDWDAGQRATQQCLELARAQGQLSGQAQCINTLAQIAAQRQDPVGRLHLHEQELVLRKRLDDCRAEAIVLARHGGGWLYLGELILARSQRH